MALRYRQHRERTPKDQWYALAQYVEHYLDRVKAQAAPGLTPATVWTEHATRLDPPLQITEFQPSGVSRSLRCFDPCCLDNPHAEMDLVVKGEVVGGTSFDRRRQWFSWGPAGDSYGHVTRSSAEVVQLNAYRGPVG